MRQSRQVPIGIIVKTWNSGEHTRLCLDAIVAADLLPEELTIVDLGEDLATRLYAEALTNRSSIRLQWMAVGRRLAPAEANRRALDTLGTPLVCLLDNDVIVPRNWLGPIISILRSPRVGLVAPIRPDPFIMYPETEESSEAVLDRIKDRSSALADVVKDFTRGQPLDEFARAVRQSNGLSSAVTLDFPSFLSSCCLCFDRSVVDEIGGVANSAFDSRYGSEDVDLSWRVLDAGYTAVRTAEVFVLHLRHASLDANQVDYAAELKAANQILYARWKKRLLAWALAIAERGETIDSQSKRFIVRELLRNTTFAADLEGARRR